MALRVCFADHMAQEVKLKSYSLFRPHVLLVEMIFRLLTVSGFLSTHHYSYIWLLYRCEEFA